MSSANIEAEPDAANVSKDEAPAARPGSHADRLIRHAVEFARDTIGLERTAIFVFDASHQRMLGTWGTDERGETFDEHQLAYEYGERDALVFDQAQSGSFWTTFEDAPLVAHTQSDSRVARQGWVAATVIPGPSQPFGILFNDTLLSGRPLDESKQQEAALLCSLLGRALLRCPPIAVPARAEIAHVKHPVVQLVANLLVERPSLSCTSIAKELKLSYSWLARTFKREMKKSIVDYRNDLRMEEFLRRVDGRAGNMQDAAFGAGFGSYAQFCRVFRGRYGCSVRAYLRSRQVTPDSEGQRPARSSTRASTGVHGPSPLLESSA